MLIAVDIGNTNIVLGFLEGGRTVGTYRISTQANHTSDEYGLMILQFLQFSTFRPDDVEDVIVASVVPKVMYSFTSSIIKFLHLEPLVVGPGIRTGMNIRIDDPRTLGADCLADCAGAYAAYGGRCLVVDMGTATTYNYVDAHATITCGLISTGIRTAAAALAGSTAQLPEVQIERPRSILAKDTRKAIQAGLYYDFLGGIERIITQFRREIHEDFRVVATGGLSRVLETPLIDVVDPDLIFKGMAAIYELNR
ncbi:type III pantothenate kinase [Bifidobacterium cuniculi]|uniref:Type III pantothenate kinase n=1 Tax=Bifidobacterium cuniculi TaxID=1688 RepID=A0A087AL22_9BIFI|nr:type III pantothenate kinase [Bifidobacterium cuniculi]KFI59472.1 pantothenate kinase [Bifidobacterium cuniculi]